MDRDAANAWQNFLGNNVGQQETGGGEHQADGGFAMGNLARFFIVFDFKGGFTHQFAFTAQPGVFFTDNIEQRGKDDGEDIGDGQNGNRGGVVLFTRTAGDGVINFRQRHRACAVAAAHNRQDIQHHDAVDGDTEAQANDNPEDGCAEDPHKDRRNITQQRFQQQLTVNREDCAGNQYCDE